MAVLDRMLDRLGSDVSSLQQGLQPEHLSFWYDKIIADTKEMAPPWLQDKIAVRQDAVLPMKFNLDMSKRAVRYFMMAVDDNSERMPYSTRLYFLRVKEILETETLKPLV